MLPQRLGGGGKQSNTLSPACTFHQLEIAPRGGYPAVMGGDTSNETYNY